MQPSTHQKALARRRQSLVGPSRGRHRRVRGARTERTAAHFKRSTTTTRGKRVNPGKRQTIPEATDSVTDPQVSYLLKKLETTERELEMERRKSRTLYQEGWRAGRNDWAELTARWRKAFETLESAVKAAHDGDQVRLSQILRSWVGRA